MSDVAVIGAGIIGVTTARTLQRAGLRVRLLDPQDPGQGCSFGNVGHIAIDHIEPLARPDVLLQLGAMLLDPLGPLSLRWRGLLRLAPWLWRFAYAARPRQVAAGTAGLAAILGRAQECWRTEIEQSGLGTLFRQQGSLVLFERDRRQETFARSGAMLADHGVRFSDLGEQEIRQFVPALTTKIRSGRFFPDAWHVVDPYALIVSMAERFVAEGGVIDRRPAFGFNLQDGQLCGIRVPGGDISATHVVVATGGQSRGLARQLGVCAPLAAERGYHVMLPQIEAFPQVPVTFAERGFVMTPMSGGMRAAGTVELGVSSTPDWRRAQLLGRHVKDLFGPAAPEPVSRWFGDRPTLPDYLPMLGRARSYPNAIMAFGHQHLGLTLAAVTAAIVKDLIVRGVSDVDLKPFRCDRF